MFSDKKFNSGDRFITRSGNKGTVVREAKSNEFGMDLATWDFTHYVVIFDDGDEKTYDVINKSMSNDKYVYVALNRDLIAI
jgi:hypothetical protein